MTNADAVLEFNIEKAIYSELSKDERQALPILTQAAKIIADIYLEQEKDHDLYLGAGFYPPNTTDSQIEKEAKKNPQILSPYTIVEKTPSGLKATPYHIKYKNNLEQISRLLKKAANIVKDEAFADYLQIAAKSLL